MKLSGLNILTLNGFMSECMIQWNSLSYSIYKKIIVTHVLQHGQHICWSELIMNIIDDIWCSFMETKRDFFKDYFIVFGHLLKSLSMCLKILKVFMSTYVSIRLIDMLEPLVTQTWTLIGYSQSSAEVKIMFNNRYAISSTVFYET